MIAYTFLVIFTALTGVYLLFLFRVRQGLRYLREHPVVPPDDGELPAITVVVPMRDEALHVGPCTASLAAQDYPAGQVEFLLVDDHSDDGTVERAVLATAGDGRFRILEAPLRLPGGKKQAIEAGVAEARHPVIVTTDADCTHERGWLRALAALHADGAEVVAGPVVLRHDGGLFGRLQAIEFLGIVGVGAGLFGVGYPRLCNGASFSYRAALFSELGGFRGNAHIPGGDDEFILHEAVYGLGRRADFAAGPDALVRTPATTSTRAFLSQRVRWASKGTQYSDGRFVSFLVTLFFYMLLAAAAPLLFFDSAAAGMAGALLLFVKAAADLSVLLPTAGMLRQPLRGADLAVAELLHAPYLVLVSIIGTFGSFTWKNRTFAKLRR